MDNLLLKLYQSSKTVLTTKEIVLPWKENNKNNLKSKGSRLAKVTMIYYFYANQSKNF